MYIEGMSTTLHTGLIHPAWCSLIGIIVPENTPGEWYPHDTGKCPGQQGGENSIPAGIGSAAGKGLK